MIDEIVLTSGLDADLPDHREADLLRKVQNEINEAADVHDIERAVKVCAYFQKAAKLSGKSLAQALYTMFLRWNDFGVGEEFQDYIYARIGVHEHTVERYIKVAQLLETLPDHVRSSIEHKGIQQLIPIANAMAQGYEISDANWEQLAEANTYQEVASVVNKEVKGVMPRENALSLVVSRDGSVLAHKGDMSPRFVGSLEINDPDPTVQQAVERIIKNSGMLKV